MNLLSQIEEVDLGVSIELERFSESGDVKRLARVYDRVVGRMGELRMEHPESYQLLDAIGNAFAGAANHLRDKARIVTVVVIDTANEEQREDMAQPVADWDWSSIYEQLR